MSDEQPPPPQPDPQAAEDPQRSLRAVAEPGVAGGAAEDPAAALPPMDDAAEADGEAPPATAFPVVGVGASAGGLQAFRLLLQHLPAKPGFAIVFVQHLAPHHDSNLPEILARETPLAVQEVRSQLRLEPDHIYVIPPDQDLAVFGGCLQLMERPQHPARHMPVDYLFRSLAEDVGRRAIGVILSGTGSDGVEGIKAIKAAGGMTLAQDAQSSGFAGMPQAAAATGQVDLVLPPARLAEELYRLAHHPDLAIKRDVRGQATPPADAEALSKIFFLLRRNRDVDFSQYKRSTVQRRIARRMVLHKIDNIQLYVQYLQHNAGEVRALFDDMLITVTSFFRDPESFATLKEKIFPQIVRGRDRTNPIRVWVPACSTGEEAYSLAIALLEYLGEQHLQVPVQIFGTDVSDGVIERARHGRYLENIAADLAEERLRKFFTKTDDGYQIDKTVRDLCVFARQNVVKDPPFSNLDLLSCRNLLIYLGPALQRRVIPMFHYALRPTGYLMLGRSETIGSFSDLFSLVDREQKIYAKKTSAVQLPAGLEPSHASEPPPLLIPADAAPPPAAALDLERQADLLVLSEFGPPGVIVNQDLQILQFRGDVSGLVAPSSGTATLNLMRMICPELKLDIRALIHQVRREHRAATQSELTCTIHGRPRQVDVEVHPLGAADGDHEHFLVLFRKQPDRPAGEHPPASTADGSTATATDDRDAELLRLRRELRQLKATMQNIIEDQDATNEELRAANEEIQSANEELQSSNEELETAKEELQSSNEELLTLNAELEHQCDAATRAIDDFNNLHRSVGIPVILLDHELRIRRFTPPAAQFLGLRDSDAGRRIGELRLGIKGQDGLEEKIRAVFNSLNTLIEEVQSEDGRWYSLQVRPYRTAEDRITGAVVVLIDITDHRHTVSQRTLAERIVATMRQPMVLLDSELRVVKANRAFYETFAVTAAETEHHLLYQLGDGQWDCPQLRRLLMEVIPCQENFRDFEILHDFPRIGRKRVVLDASRVDQKGSQTELILLCVSEVSDVRTA